MTATLLKHVAVKMHYFGVSELKSAKFKIRSVPSFKIPKIREFFLNS